MRRKIREARVVVNPDTLALEVAPVGGGRDSRFGGRGDDVRDGGAGPGSGTGGGRGRFRDRIRRRIGGRMRHGEVRASLLLALQAGPAHGYELGLRLEQASQGAWKPSPGSIYPTLQTLADQGLVSSEERDGKRIFTLTKRGHAELAARADRGEEAPWHDTDSESGELRESMHALKMAAKQVGTVGTPEQCAKAQAILVEARRKLYELLSQ